MMHENLFLSSIFFTTDPPQLRQPRCRASLSSMLPPELVELICNLLDLADLCAIAETEIFSIPDSIFKQKLEPLCPWFEPQFSCRNSYRECAMEYLRRQQPGAKFAPRLRRAGPEEFGSVMRLSPKNGTHAAPLVTPAKELRTCVYTSNHGIKVDLSKENEWWDWEEQEEEGGDEVMSEIISLPQMLIITTLGNCQMYCCFGGGNATVIVKFKDSPGLEPDIVHHAGVDCFFLQIMGPHVFLFEFASSCFGADPYWTANYLHQKRFRELQSRKESESPWHLIFYDGLLQYFEPKRYCAIQLSLDIDTKTITDKVRSKHVVHVDQAHPLDKRDYRYSIIEGKNEKLYIHDITTRLVVDANQLGESGMLDADLIRRMDELVINDES